MGISLNVTKDTWGVDSLDWLATRKGFDTCRPGTLDLTLFTVDHYLQGFIPSGTVVAVLTSTGLLGPYTPANVLGLGVAFGHILQSARVADSRGNPFTRAAVAVVWEGVVLRSKLPNFLLTANGLGELDADAETDLRFIRYEP